MDHRLAAEQQHGGEPKLGDEADQGVVVRLEARRDHRLVEDPPNASVEALELAVLAGEGLHDAHAGDVLLGVRGELGDPLLYLLHRGTRASTVALRNYDDERDGRHRDQAKPDVRHDHCDAGEDDRERGLHDEYEPIAEEEADGLQVDGRARHQLPRLLTVEEAQLETLKVPVEALAEVVLEPQRHRARDHPPAVGQDPACEHRADDREREDEQRMTSVGAHRRPVGSRAFRDGVDRVARERRDEDRHDNRRGPKRERDRHTPAVGP